MPRGTEKHRAEVINSRHGDYSMNGQETTVKADQQPAVITPKCLRKSDLEAILNVKRTTRQRITRLPDFPKPFKLDGTIEVWDREEVYQWLETQKAEHGGN